MNFSQTQAGLIQMMKALFIGDKSQLALIIKDPAMKIALETVTGPNFVPNQPITTMGADVVPAPLACRRLPERR